VKSSKVRVGVLFGGRSGEHEVSLASAQSVMDALDRRKYEVIPIGITRSGGWLTGEAPMARLQQEASKAGRILTPGAAVPGAPTTNALAADAAVERRLVARSALHAPISARVDVVFPVLHGPYGEDGTVQGLLELANIAYVGAGVLGSALGMDKIAQKTLFRAAGLPVVDWIPIRRRQWSEDAPGVCEIVEATLGYPCFTKPANLGSSVGISKAKNRAELVSGLDLAARHDRRLLVEKAAVDCREVECSVLGNDEPVASVPGEVRPHGEFYDYDAKYRSGDTELVIPADLPAAIAQQVRGLAVDAFRAIDCAGMARVDFFVARHFSQVYVNEINTIPGFTAISMYPKLWQASGLSYSELLDRLITLALERHAEKNGREG
jgi:D-alanine-D-alanine ligase